MIRITAMKCMYQLLTTMILLSISTVHCDTAHAQGNFVKLADGVYSYVDILNSGPQNSYGANAGIVIGKNGIAVIDTFISANAAKIFIKNIRSLSDKPIRYVINTHYHIDHTFGNSEFARIGATIISHTNTKNNIEMFGEGALKNIENFGLTKEEMEGTVLAYPSLSFDKRMMLDLGDRKIELIYPGPSHTNGSIIAYLAGEKILFAGDILVTGYHPFLAEGNIKDWIKALDYLTSLDAKTIIPGHGPISTQKDLHDMKKYLTVFDKRTKGLMSESKNIDFIVDNLNKILPPRSEGDVFIKPSVELKYLKTAHKINLNN